LAQKEVVIMSVAAQHTLDSLCLDKRDDALNFGVVVEVRRDCLVA
jgi:hypothetical protein